MSDGRDAERGAAAPATPAALARALASLLLAEFDLRRPGRAVIGVAGELGSGKSVTATGLAGALGDAGVPAGVLHQDDYFHRPPRTNHEHRCLDLRHVGPHEVNLALLQAHVAAFRSGAAGVQAPRVDYPGNRFVTQQVDFSPLAALVVEGTYVLQLDDLDVRIFLTATHHDTRERRRARNRDIDAPIVDQVLAIEHALIAPQVERAHVVIDRDFTIARRPR